MIQSQQLAEGLYKILKTTDSKDVEPVFDAFVVFLEENKIVSQLPTIVHYLENYSLQEKKFNTLTIESVFPLTDKVQEKIRSSITKDTKVSIVVKENKKLIGGFRAVFQDSVMDGSIAYNLQVLKNILTK